MKYLTLFLINLLMSPLFSATSGSAEVLASIDKSEPPTVTESIVNETVEGKTTKVKWVISKNDQTRQITRKTATETETISGLTSTQRWSLETKEKTLTIYVEDDNAIIKVTKDKQTTSKTLNLNNNKILFPPSFYLKPFVNSNDQKLVAWSINIKDETLRKMIFTKLGKETLTINNKDYECIKIEMKPTGFAGVVWKAYYWLDVNNGKFVKYFGKKGPPGTPDYTIEIAN